MLVGSLLVLSAVLAVASQALAATITNGGFEAGNFTGWTVANQAGGSGNWYVYSNSSKPIESCTGSGAPQAPPQGSFAATSDQSNPGSHVLYQDIALEAGAKHSLSFTLYYNNTDGFFSPPSLDYTVTPNQQYRVDIMKPSAAPFSVAPSDILETLYQTTSSSPATLTPTTMTFDLSAFAGQTVRLRFAEVDNGGCFLASVDNVGIASTPSVQTGTATSITNTSATLNGTVDPDGQATTYHFDYGTSTSYGHRMPAADASVGADSASHPESQPISGLTPNTTYHFRIVATNASGTTVGADHTFTTGAIPSATTLAATKVDARAATLNGEVNPQDASTSYYFEYGTSTSYGSRAPGSAALVGSDASNHSVSRRIAGLKPGTTYHFRIVAVNSSATTFGADRTFKTKAAPQLRLTVSPGRASAGTSACFSFSASSRGHGVSGATVRFAGRTASTSSAGTASICAKLTKGTYHPTVSKRGFTAGRATVLAVAAVKFTG